MIFSLRRCFTYCIIMTKNRNETIFSVLSKDWSENSVLHDVAEQGRLFSLKDAE